MKFCENCDKKDVCKYKIIAEEFGKQVRANNDSKYDFITIQYNCKYNMPFQNVKRAEITN